MNDMEKATNDVEINGLEPETQANKNYEIPGVLGKDLTPICDVHEHIISDEGLVLNGNVDLMQEYDQFLAKELDDEALGALKPEECGEMVNRFCQEFGKAEAKIEGSYSLYAIKVGRGLNLAKRRLLEEHPDANWEIWADANIPFIAKRTRQVYMRLARFKMAENYAVLGLDRLLLLMNATRDIKAPLDPIGAFFTKYGISFNPQSIAPLGELKHQVDVALERHKGDKANLPLNPELVEKLVREKKSLKPADIDEMKRIKASSGDPNTHLQLLLTEDPVSKGKPDKFTKIKETLTRSIRAIVESNEVPAGVDINDVENLMKELKALHELLFKLGEQSGQAA